MTAAAAAADSALLAAATEIRRELPLLPLEAAAQSSNPLIFGTFSIKESARHIVDGIPHDRHIVLLGECTHGTSEFYKTRSEITKKLIEERGFSVVALEADFSMGTRINDYVHRRAKEPWKPLEERSFPQWMWPNAEFEEFVEWCKRRAPASMEREAGSKPIDIFGLDCYSMRESKEAVIAFLEEYDKEFAAEVKGRLAFLDKYKTGFEYADAVVNGNLKHIAQHMTTCLSSIQSRLQWGSDRYKCSKYERLCAEQNLEVVIAADEYYRTSITEPSGSQASWGIRDQCMTLALMKIRAHFGDKTKVVCWAHNSHVGDSMATNRGGVSFEKNDTWNLGQMCRATFGASDCWIVGQYCYGGKVVAADNWGGAYSEKQLRPALPESTEALLHEKVFLPHVKPHPVSRDPAQMGKASFFFATMPFADPYQRGSSAARTTAGGAAASTTAAGAAIVRTALEQTNDPIAKALCDIMNIVNSEKRLQRWVGVSYKPDTERQSHYGAMNMALCYDQVVFVDDTSGVGRLKTAEEKLAEAAVERDAATGEQQVVSAATMKRLMKEYSLLRQSPPHGIEAHPCEQNILEWHFKFDRFDGTPYERGEYHGVVSFLPGYPHRAPSFRMLTPSGRFECGTSICTSASVWHESDGGWSPSWSVSTLLVGLYSFMREESNGIGSIKMSATERRKLAEQSRAFNLKNPIYVELFESNRKKSSLESDAALGSNNNSNSSAPQESVCRICFSSDGELISPCSCTGSNQFVHLECLREWQKNVLLNENTHPKYRNNADCICQTCLQPFSGPGIPPSRHETILKYAGGEQISKLIAPGNLLVSSREKSLEYVQLMQAHPEVKKNLAPWTKAVFLIIQSSKDHMLGVSVSAPLDSPADAPGMSGLLNRAAWVLRTARGKTRGIRYLCWNGGPVHGDVMLPVVHLPNAREVAAAARAANKDTKILFVPPFFLFSYSLEEMENVVAAQYAERKKKFEALSAEDESDRAKAAPLEDITINVCVGAAGWGATQILAEIARSGWSLCHQDDWLSIRPDPSMEVSWIDDFKWERIYPMSKLAPKTEYSKRG